MALVHAVVMIAYVRNFELPAIHVGKKVNHRHGRRSSGDKEGRAAAGDGSETDTDPDEKKGMAARAQENIRRRYARIAGHVGGLINQMKAGVGAARLPGLTRQVRKAPAGGVVDGSEGGGSGGSGGDGGGGDGTGSRDVDGNGTNTTVTSGGDGVSRIDVSAAAVLEPKPELGPVKTTWLGRLRTRVHHQRLRQGDQSRAHTNGSHSDKTYGEHGALDNAPTPASVSTPSFVPTSSTTAAAAATINSTPRPPGKTKAPPAYRVRPSLYHESNDYGLIFVIIAALSVVSKYAAQLRVFQRGGTLEDIAGPG